MATPGEKRAIAVDAKMGQSMRVTQIDQGWEFRLSSPGPGFHRPNSPAEVWRQATVPGCVHDDLIRCGVIADPFQKEFEAGCQWVGEEDWTYRTTFHWTPNALRRRILRFEGLDTVCSIHLNGEEIARHENMFLPLEVDVSDTLIEGENEIEVRFQSAVRVGIERRKAYVEENGIAWDTNFFDERAFVRKAQYMSGWDWGPRLVSCGIWRPIELLEFESRITSFTVFQELLEGGAFRVWSETHLEAEADLETSFDGKSYKGDFDVVVQEPKLWWPNGEGEPFLYEATSRLDSGDEVSKRIGLRTIRLVREPDEQGESFEFEVNGRRVWSRGANWIPNDSFPSRLNVENYRTQLEICRDLGMNMLRVWGGGLYESDAFYDSCDELGLMVWQDFPYACSYYPDSPEYCEKAAQEAEFHVRRLRDRTSLAIWCGNNENDVMWQSRWGGAEKSPDRYYGEVLYRETLAGVCARLDPNRPYIHTSPIGGHDVEKSWGDEHYWDVWHGRGDWKFYAESSTRFSSEFGFASACGPAAWRRADIEPSQALRTHSAVRWHDKTNKPWEVFRDMVELHYPASEALEDWIYYSQLNQRDALRFGIEHYRMNEPCRGTLIWQFNDCWPVQSWAVQDYARKLKPAGFELQRLYAPVLLSIRVEEDEVVLLAANDRPVSFVYQAELRFVSTDGKTLHSETVDVQLAPSERKEILRASLRDFEKNETVVSAAFASAAKSATWRTLAEPKEMRWQKPKLCLDEELFLRVEGLAYDLVLDYPDTGQPVAFESQHLIGSQAITFANDSIRIQRAGATSRIRARTLAGIEILEVAHLR